MGLRRKLLKVNGLTFIERYFDVLETIQRVYSFSVTLSLCLVLPESFIESTGSKIGASCCQNIVAKLSLLSGRSKANP